MFRVETMLHNGARQSISLILATQVLIVVLWSTAFTVTKLSLAYGEPFTLLFWRYALACITMLGHGLILFLMFLVFLICQFNADFIFT